MTHYKILIVGGGNAGLSVAAKLLRKDSGLQIGIIDPAEKHYYQPAFTLVGAGIFDVNKTIRKENELIPSRATLIKEGVSKFYPDSNEVECMSGLRLSYDVLIVCPGIQLDWDKIQGSKEALGHHEISSNYLADYAPYTWELIKNFKGGTAVFTNPPNAIKCGGAPHKIMYLACDYWRKKGILSKCDVHYISGGGVLFGIKEYAETLNKAVANYGIKTHFKANVKSIKGEKKSISFETNVPLADLRQSLSSLSADKCTILPAGSEQEMHQVTLNFDMCHIVPPQSAPDFVKLSPLADPQNAAGYVEVDMHTLQHQRYSNVFSLGDCSSAPCSKTGAAIRKQAPVVVENILSFLKGQTPNARYEGYSACPIPTEYGKLMLAEFDYSNKPAMTFPFDQAKPRWSMWLLKTKVLPWLYWNKIVKGTA